MPYLIAVIAAFLAFAGFLLLTLYEAKRGTRFFASARYRLDRKAGKLFFVAGHVDWGAFTAHLTRTTFTTVAHDLAHGSLVAVRAVERFLTRAVRTLRLRRDDAASLPASPKVVPALVAERVEPVDAEPVANNVDSDSEAVPVPEEAGAEVFPAAPVPASTEVEAKPRTSRKKRTLPTPERVPSQESLANDDAALLKSPTRRAPRKIFDIRPPSRRG